MFVLYKLLTLWLFIHELLVHTYLNSFIFILIGVWRNYLIDKKGHEWLSVYLTLMSFFFHCYLELMPTEYANDSQLYACNNSYRDFNVGSSLNVHGVAPIFPQLCMKYHLFEWSGGYNNDRGIYDTMESGIENSSLWFANVFYCIQMV